MTVLVFVLVIASLLIGLAVYIACETLRDWLRLHRAWGSGRTAEGRCLRAYTSTRRVGEQRGEHTVQYHVYEFMTADGRDVRFEEAGGPGSRCAGDFVTVYYGADPAVAATALPPRRAQSAAGALGVLVFLGVLVVFAVFWLTLWF
ncbi:hypothetical protein Stsp02_10420 [Streptomyces sp. NBRC 14336]|uniref:DUF3592 domain-containing protein n=1 Tax=Streptomyces sp. NBRC 14336 TaxID=3030992 RepID=UPI0024A4F369|nr:DUF3592 domain-containing protein [Streptomyces sp. NBRC 14336]WBO78204.1 hypothetical protein SBE_001789 [Streptomyces sp. SBE_14.2]GLW45380.1 hypothetical protein Stsp02_10420 [Streptomyces sp. NBRC 14336]